jgi:hypothetical protein
MRNQEAAKLRMLISFFLLHDLKLCQDSNLDI